MQMIWEEFKKFALKGNVVDLAVGVIIGGAFGKVVSALVDNVLTPPLGLLIGGMDFSHLRLVLLAAKDGQAEVSVGYGLFLQALVNFMIVAWSLFVFIKLMNKLHLEAISNTTTPEDVLLLREIRDELKKP